ncbi:MAG: MiaB/RimO family radical SAM methylthiotransferase [Candidatus Omnitrophota bacterium]
MKKFFIKTFGCQMNVRDSEIISGLLKKEGYRMSDDPGKADIIIFNTCSVRQHAEDKVWSEVGRIRKCVVQSPKSIDKKLRTLNHEPITKPIIGLVGCMAQNYKEKVFERAPSVDFAVGPSDIYKIPEIIKRFSVLGSRLSGKNMFETKIWETDGEIRPDEIYRTGFYEDKEHAYVVISEGCSNYCSYCVVPFVRGQIRNRGYKDILREIEEAVDKGVTRITLLGQNVNAYKSGAGSKELSIGNKESEADFIKLLELVNNIKGIKEFGFITSHPKDTGIALFEAMAAADKLKKYLHLPAQSGSDRILEMMNRGYTRNFYLDLVDNYRRIIKGGVLSSDVIVGFPTEREDDFCDTRDLVKAVEFDVAYIFKYSPRPHTEAGKLADDVKKEEKERRHGIILDLQKEISRKKKCSRR